MKKNSDILNKLRYESENTNEVHLWLEGMFWKAYERSAYLFVRRISGYKPYKKFVRSVGGEVVAIGFPSKSIEKLLEGRSVEYVDEKHYILNGFTVDAQELRNFQMWKKGIPSFPYHVIEAGENKNDAMPGEKEGNEQSDKLKETVRLKETAEKEKEAVAVRKERRRLSEEVSRPREERVHSYEPYPAPLQRGQEERGALIEELRRFRMESSTPLECMMFLAHLIKKSLEIENN